MKSPGDMLEKSIIFSAAKRSCRILRTCLIPSENSSCDGSLGKCVPFEAGGQWMTGQFQNGVAADPVSLSGITGARTQSASGGHDEESRLL